MNSLERLSDANLALAGLYEAARDAEVEVARLVAEVEEGRARTARLAEEIWKMTGDKEAIL